MDWVPIYQNGCPGNCYCRALTSVSNSNSSCCWTLIFVISALPQVLEKYFVLFSWQGCIDCPCSLCSPWSHVAAHFLLTPFSSAAPVIAVHRPNQRKRFICSVIHPWELLLLRLWGNRWLFPRQPPNQLKLVSPTLTSLDGEKKNVSILNCDIQSASRLPGRLNSRWEFEWGRERSRYQQAYDLSPGKVLRLEAWLIATKQPEWMCLPIYCRKG